MSLVSSNLENTERVQELERENCRLLAEIEKLKRTECILKANKNRLKMAQEYSAVGTWDWNVADGQLIWSDTLKKLYGKGIDFVPTLEAFAEIIHPDDRDALLNGLEQIFQKGGSHHAEFRVILPDGSIRWIEGRGRTVHDQHHHFIQILGIAMDITQRKNVEEQIQKQSIAMVHMSKMSALGEMAAGMAHEINNPLAIIQANVSLAKKVLAAAHLESSGRVQECLSAIENTTQRVVAIVEGLRTFGRDGSKDRFESADLNKIITDTLVLCAEKFKKQSIQVVRSDASKKIMIHCRPVQVSQVLLNLLSNAFDALESTLEKKIEIEVVESDREVKLHIIDTGIGMTEEMQTNVFRPFFTTKGVGKGTGLGLSIAKGIMESHGGELMVESRASPTCFTLRFQCQSL